MRPRFCSLFLFGIAACSSGAPLSDADRRGIAREVRGILESAYDLSKGDVVRRMMSIYPSSGRVVSATAGRVTTSRDSLQMAVNAFWDGVGQYMVDPTWKWDRIEVDVLSLDAAVLTANYYVPHWTDQGAPHVIGGTWTTVWQRTAEGWRVVNEHLSDLPRPVAERIEATMQPHDSTASHQAHPR
jgi:ketosteroid isomerase-like protein